MSNIPDSADGFDYSDKSGSRERCHGVDKDMHGKHNDELCHLRKWEKNREYEGKMTGGDGRVSRRMWNIAKRSRG